MRTHMRGTTFQLLLVLVATSAICRADLAFVYIDDPGFTGYMSVYETTNDDYVQFLNAALASGDITVSGNDVLGASGPYAGQLYYDGDGSGIANYGATNGGAARIHYSSGAFVVDEGFENHPVTYVSWYGATAFSDYYGYYLPTAEQWQAVADYDGTYTYACGTTINTAIANYKDSSHPDGTTPVGSFGQYGYGMSDMTGNLWEWTSSIEEVSSNTWHVLHGGAWNCDDFISYISNKAYNNPKLLATIMVFGLPPTSFKSSPFPVPLCSASSAWAWRAIESGRSSSASIACLACASDVHFTARRYRFCLTAGDCPPRTRLCFGPAS